MPFRAPPDLQDDGAVIAAMAARHCKLAHPNIVEQIKGAVFQTIRDKQRRGTIDYKQRLLLDDNVTPRWALFWAHGIAQTHHPLGWTIAHVWAVAKDPTAYTHLANLCLMPECLGSLSDKAGPLCAYLRLHAYDAYGWHPANTSPPTKPTDYDQIKWAYFDEFPDPEEFIKVRIMTLKNQRVTALRSLMGFADE